MTRLGLLDAVLLVPTGSILILFGAHMAAMPQQWQRKVHQTAWRAGLAVHDIIPNSCSFQTTCSAESAARTRSGVIGSRSIRTPVASNTALAITAPVVVVAGSPQP